MSRCATLLVCSLLLAACGSGHPLDDGKTRLVYDGVFAGEDGTEAGSFNVTLIVEDSSGSGTFRVNGVTKSFSTLTYDGDTVVASGQSYAFTGAVDDSTVTGSYAGPTGGGLFTGLKSFNGSAAPKSYCGTHIGTRNGIPIAGPFAFVVGNGVRRGVFTTVLSEPFRGLVRSSAATSAVSLDTLSGAADLTIQPASFTGSYAMAAGDTGLVAGNICKTGFVLPNGTVFDGVFGNFAGTVLGNFFFNLSSTGVGSTGTYTVDTVGGATRPFLAVISGVNNQVAAFDSGYRVIASLDTATIEGTYTDNGGIAGRVAALHRLGSTPSQGYCGQHSLGGAFAFLVRGDSTLFGLYTGGSLGAAFQGVITGKPGDFGQLETETGAVTILPTPGNPGSFGGFWDHSATGGTSGTLTGVTCP